MEKELWKMIFRLMNIIWKSSFNKAGKFSDVREWHMVKIKANN